MLPCKGHLHQSFDNESARKGTGRTLYHSMPVAPKADSLLASPCYSMPIPGHVKAALGIAPDERVPLVFASEHITQTLLFGFNGREKDKEKVLTATIAGTDTSVVIICNRDVTMAKPRNVTVYGFSDEGFVDLDPSTRHSVRTEPVPFSKTTKVLEATCAEDFLRAGLQVFSFREPMHMIGGWSIPDIMANNKWSLEDYLGHAVRNGRLVWENHERGIEPHPVLLERLADSIPAFGKAAPALVAKRVLSL